MFILNTGVEAPNNAPSAPIIQPNTGAQPQLNLSAAPAPATGTAPSAPEPAAPVIPAPVAPPKPLQLGQPTEQLTAEQQLLRVQQKMDLLEQQNRNLQYYIQSRQPQVQTQTQPQRTTSTAQQAAAVQTGQVGFDDDDVLTFGGAKNVVKEVLQQTLTEMKSEQDTQAQWETFYNNKEMEILNQYDLNVDPKEIFPKIHFFATYLMHQGVDPNVAYRQATYGHLMQKGQGYGMASVQPQFLHNGVNPYGVNGVAPQGQVQGNVPQYPGVNAQQINGQRVVQAPTLPGSPEAPGQLIQPGNIQTEVARLKSEADALLSESRTSEQGYRRWMEANRRYKVAARSAAAQGRL